MNARVLVLGLLLLLPPVTAAADNAWTIHAGEIEVLEDTEMLVEGDLVVEGTLILHRARLVFLQTEERPSSLIVRNGGRIETYDSTITTLADRLAPYPWLNLTVDRASAHFEGSELRFPTAPFGDTSRLVWFHESEVKFLRSTLGNLTAAELAPADWTRTYPIDEADDGPLVVADASTVTFVGSRMERPYELKEYDWVPFPASRFAPRNTVQEPGPGSVLHGDPVRIPPGKTLHIAGFEKARDAHLAQLVIGHVAPDGFSRAVDVLLGTDAKLASAGKIMPSKGQKEFRVDLTRAGIPLDRLGALEVLLRNDGPTDVFLDVRVDASWRAPEQGPRLRDGTVFEAVDSFLDIDWQDPHAAPGLANHLHVEGGSRLRILNVTVDDAETAGVRRDAAIVVTGDGSEAVIYRRLDVRTVTAAGAPVARVAVELQRTGIDPEADADADRLNAESGLFAASITAQSAADGRARLVAVSDVIRPGSDGDPDYLGQYEARARIGRVDFGTSSVALPTYPRLAAADNHVVRTIELAQDLLLASTGGGLQDVEVHPGDDGTALVIGRVEPPSGTPKSGIAVTVEAVPLAVGGQPVRASGTTDADGRFVISLTGLDDTDYTVTARTPGGESARVLLQNAGSDDERLGWILLGTLIALGAVAYAVHRLRTRKPLARCGHCAAPTTLDALGCDDCGALYGERSIHHVACPAANASGPCPGCQPHTP